MTAKRKSPWQTLKETARYWHDQAQFWNRETHRLIYEATQLRRELADQKAEAEMWRETSARLDALREATARELADARAAAAQRESLVAWAGEKYTVHFDADEGFFGWESGGGWISAVDEDFAVLLFRAWWREKQNRAARSKGQSSIYDRPPTKAHH